MIYRLRGIIVAFFLLFVLSHSPSCQNEWWLLLLLPGIALRIWARCFIGSHTRSESLEAPNLVRQGPYAYVRHPLYLSNILILWVLLFWWIGVGVHSLVLAVVVAVFYYWLANKEDAFLQQIFAQDWEDWKTQVQHRFLPKKIPTDLLQGAEQTWLQAVQADRWTWIWLLAGIALSFAFKAHRCGY